MALVGLCSSQVGSLLHADLCVPSQLDTVTRGTEPLVTSKNSISCRYRWEALFHCPRQKEHLSPFRKLPPTSHRIQMKPSSSSATNACLRSIHPLGYHPSHKQGWVSVAFLFWWQARKKAQEGAWLINESGSEGCPQVCSVPHRGSPLKPKRETLWGLQWERPQSSCPNKSRILDTNNLLPS